MTAKEFLKSKNIWVEQLVADENAPENYIRLEDLLEEYANQQLQLCGVVGQSEQLKPEFPKDRITKHQEG